MRAKQKLATVSTPTVTFKDRPVFDIPTIRLSADETRLIMNCSRTGVLLRAYGGEGLVNLGILEHASVAKNKIDATKIDTIWKRIARLAGSSTATHALKNTEIAKLLNAASKLLREAQPEKGLRLTELGKQLARGLSVRLAANR